MRRITLPLKLSQYSIAFDSKGHHKSTKAVGNILRICTLTINNIGVTKTLVDGGAGLDIISVETLKKLQVPYE